MSRIFYLIFLTTITVHSSSVAEKVESIGLSAAVGGFFFFIVGAVPSFVMSAYQAYYNNAAHTDSSSPIIKFLYPLIMRLDEQSCTINPTTIGSKEYLLSGLGISGLSASLLLLGWILSKIQAPLTEIDNAYFSK